MFAGLGFLLVGETLMARESCTRFVIYGPSDSNAPLACWADMTECMLTDTYPEGVVLSSGLVRGAYPTALSGC